MPQQTQSGAVSGVPSVPTPKIAAVLVIETAKQGVTAQQIMPIIPEEIRATVKLYLDGKIQQWYSRGDGKGAVDGSAVHSRRSLDAVEGIDRPGSAVVPKRQRQRIGRRLLRKQVT